MKNLYETIRRDMRNFVKNGHKVEAGQLKVLLSDIQRSPTKDYSDEAVIRVIQSTLKKLNEAVDKGIILPDFDVNVRLYKKYLPESVPESEIREFLDTIDFSELKNYKIAIGMVKRHFKDKIVDMKLVSRIVEEYK